MAFLTWTVFQISFILESYDYQVLLHSPRWPRTHDLSSSTSWVLCWGARIIVASLLYSFLWAKVSHRPERSHLSMCQFVDIAGVCTFGLGCNMLVSVCGQHVWACFHCFWVTRGRQRMACVGSSLSFEELHTVSTKTTLFHYPRQALDAGLIFPVLANTWYCLLLVLSWFLFFSCYSHQDGCGVLMTNDICVLSGTFMCFLSIILVVFLLFYGCSQYLY